MKYAGIKGTEVRIGWLLLASLSERIDRENKSASSSVFLSYLRTIWLQLT